MHAIDRALSLSIIICINKLKTVEDASVSKKSEKKQQKRKITALTSKNANCEIAKNNEKKPFQ